jgi:PAS domain S-box-containing protein
VEQGERLRIPALEPTHSYLVALLAIAAVTATRLVFDPWIGTAPLGILFVLPIAVLAYAGGLRAGLAATALACAALAFLVIEPRQSFAMADVNHRWQFALLSVSGIVISASFEAEHRARRSWLLLSVRYQSLSQEYAGKTEALEAAQRVARMGSWDHDIRTGALTWSAEIHRMFGTDPATFQPNYAAFLQHVAPGDRERVDRALRESLQDFAPHELTHGIVTESGEARWVIERWQAMPADGAPVRVVGTCQDVTERLLDERRLHESERRYRDLLEASPLAVWAYDADSLRYLLVNEAATRLYGYSREEFTAMTVLDIRAERDAAQVRDAIAAMLPGRYYQRRSCHRHRDGNLIEVEVFTHLAAHHGRPVVVSVIFDVTERERQRREREALDLQLRDVSRRLVLLQEEERRAIAAELHDRVGQSLSVLGIQLSMLAGALVKPESQRLVAEATAILEETGQAVRGVIRDLRPEGLQEFGLAAALRNLAAITERRTGVTVRVLTANGMRLPEAVELAWFRICQEALANVAKHARAARVWVAVKQTHTGAVLCVADDGAGFDTRAVAPAGRSRWGLLMMRERAEAAGSRLRISSRPGRGTQVVISWKDPAYGSSRVPRQHNPS